MPALLPLSDYFAPRAEPARLNATQTALESSQPELLRSILLLWGHPEMNAWFDRIWSGESGAGLDPEVIAELMLLSQMHRWLMPTPTPQVSLPTQRHAREPDPWARGFSR